MLEVRSEDNGIWVGNKNNRVWITSHLLDAKAQLIPTPDHAEGELVYTQKDPLIVGWTYTKSEIIERATDKTVIVNDLGNSYQYLSDCWHSTSSCLTLSQIPSGNYTVVWVQE